MARSKTFSISELAALLGCSFQGDGSALLSGVASLEAADAGQLSVLSDAKYKSAALASQAGAILVHRNDAANFSTPCIISNNPKIDFEKAVSAFLGPERLQTGFCGVHPTAVIHETANVHPSVQIGPFCVIDADAFIGENVQLGPYVSVGRGSAVGAGCLIHSHVSIREGCRIGARCTLHPHVTIGNCGFGFATDAAGIHHKQRQLGGVLIEEDCEIGANTAVARGHFTDTRIGRGTKIDCLVQIAHNVAVGEQNIVVALSGLAGSSSTGKNVVIAAQAGITGHVHVCDGAIISGRAGVSKNITEPGIYSGTPAIPRAQEARQLIRIRQLDKMFARLEILESVVEENSHLFNN